MVHFVQINLFISGCNLLYAPSRFTAQCFCLLPTEVQVAAVKALIKKIFAVMLVVWVY